MTTIYFPSIFARATVNAKVKRGAFALVCDAHDGESLRGEIRGVKFTTVEPKSRAWKESEIDVLHPMPKGGFCYYLI